MAIACGAVPPQVGPIEVVVTNPSVPVDANSTFPVSVTNQNIPVHVQPSWATLSQVYSGWNRFAVPGYMVGTGGGAILFEIFDHVVVTEVFVSASSAAPPETDGDCLAMIGGTTQATGYQSLASFSVPAGHYAAWTISLPNLYFTAADDAEYKHFFGHSHVGASGDTYPCKLFFEVRYENAD